MSVSIALANLFAALAKASGAGPSPPVSNLFGTLTTVGSGGSSTLSQATVQRVELATGGAAATVLFPASPTDGDIIFVKTTGTTVSNQGVINPNGNNIESATSPGTTGSTNVLMGPNPGAGALYIYETSGTLWRLWL